MNAISNTSEPISAPAVDEPHTLLARQVFARPRGEVFAFFADAHNLDLITPPWLRFRILTPRPIRMGVGTLIDYRIRLHGIPIRWRTRISAWEPPFRFVDEQIRGPYAMWVHEHRFEETDGGTVMSDSVTYRLPLSGLPGIGLVHRRLVRPDLERIFAYRRDVMARTFADDAGGINP